MSKKSSITFTLVVSPFFRLEDKIRNPMDEDNQ
jgi:hypothetical protein